MRLWLVIGALVVAAALVVVIPRLGDDEPHTPRPGHPETLAAAIALTYARGVQVRDMNIACGTMTTDAARAVGCGTANARPRACGDFSIPGTRIVRFEDGARATVDVGACRIELVPGARTQWAVARVAPAD
jgi:hypothetical protein